ncbi:TetR/AcrR family transcriptional regulator [Bacterioplanoides sp.]|uniref:TetR/AcrR family transcriptional regulator n=1 Tax=Bacterioplanoides sp. TaxID=2066072 RepID=UPI003B5BFD43
MAVKRNTESRKQPSQERSKKMVEKILKATREVLLKDGVDGLSTRKIAAQAGISTGSLYQYFPNKLAVVKAIYSACLEDVISDLEVLVDIPPMSIGEFMETLDTRLDRFYTPEKYSESSPDRAFELELFKAMNIFKELREIDEQHERNVVNVLANGLAKVFVDQSPDNLLRVSTYLYGIHTAFDEILVAGICESAPLLIPHKKAMVAVIQTLE